MTKRRRPAREKSAHTYKEEAGQELGFFRHEGEIRALSALKKIWERIKKARKSP